MSDLTYDCMRCGLELPAGSDSEFPEDWIKLPLLKNKVETIYKLPRELCYECAKDFVTFLRGAETARVRP